MNVSVIVPCFNVEEYLDECLNSVIIQNHPISSIICVDNNSADSTLDILQKWKERDERIRVLKESKRGASYARNRGLMEVKSDWVQFLDADDLLEKHKIAHQLKLIEDYRDHVDFIAAASNRQKMDGTKSLSIPKDDPWKAVFVTGLGNTCSNLWRTESIRKIGGWNEELQSSQESDLMFRLLKSGAVVMFDQEPLTVIRERHSGQISKSNVVVNLQRYAKLRVEMIDHIMQSNEYWEKNADFYMSHLIILAERLNSVKLLDECHDLTTIISNHYSSLSWKSRLKYLRLKLLK